MLGAAAGALFGVSDIAIKFLADDIASGVLELNRHPVDGGSGYRLGGRVLRLRAWPQIGPGVDVIAITSVAANLTAIVGGVLVFRDPVGNV